MKLIDITNEYEIIKCPNCGRMMIEISSSIEAKWIKESLFNGHYQLTQIDYKCIDCAIMMRRVLEE